MKDRDDVPIPLTLEHADLAEFLRAASGLAGPDFVNVRVSATCERCALPIHPVAVRLSRGFLRSVVNAGSLAKTLRGEVERAHGHACDVRRFYRVRSALLAWRDSGGDRCATGCAFPGTDAARRRVSSPSFGRVTDARR